MSLNERPNHPSRRAYVVKLHRDAQQDRALLCGRLENMSTGRSFNFHSGEELLNLLLGDAFDPPDDAAAQRP